jgi:hypothetical protein
VAVATAFQENAPEKDHRSSSILIANSTPF